MGTKMDYNLYMQKALRTVIKDVLTDVSQKGMEDNQHFFITFETDREDVVLPSFVKAKYPQEITIVLQHQFENLEALENEFRVDLAFGGVNTTIVVPYSAIKQFFDPSVEFGLSLTPEKSQTPTSEIQEEILEENLPAGVIDLSKWRKK